MRTVSKIAAFAACLTCFPVMAFGLDGDIGPTSTGSSLITLEIEPLIVVGGMEDFVFGAWSGGTLNPIDHDIYIAGNDDQGSETYQAVLTGNGASSAFTLARTSPASPAHALAYTVNFNDEASAGGTAATTGVAITGQTGIHTVLTTTTDNANIQVSIATGALNAAPYGDYEGTLTIVVTPE